MSNNRKREKYNELKRIFLGLIRYFVIYFVIRYVVLGKEITMSLLLALSFTVLSYGIVKYSLDIQAKNQ